MPRGCYLGGVGSSASEVRSLLERLAGALGAGIVPLDALAAYAELVGLWNQKLNLTGAREAPALVEVLFADAMVLARPELLPQRARFVDVGAGAGAPSLPLLLLRPDLQGTLVEPIRKRVAFLRTAVGTLELVERARVEERRLEGPPLAGAPFDVALSRATFDPAAWLVEGLGLAERVLVLAASELPEATGVRRVAERRYRLPFSLAPRAVGLYERSRSSGGADGRLGTPGRE